jgi:hypothetical protein
MKIFFLILLISPGVWAQTYYLNIKSSVGNFSYPLEDIRKITFDPTVDVEDFNKLKDILNTFTLLQNYPNPFNPTTTIEFNIPYSSHVEVNIFDINGQLIAKVLNDILGEGHHLTKWNGKNDQGYIVASGAYIYQVKFDNKIISKKMLFIK